MPTNSYKNRISRPNTKNVFTCEKCEMTTDKKIGGCSYCGHRLLTSEEVEERKNAIGYGTLLIVFGLLTGIITAIVIAFQKDFVFAELFIETAFDGDFLNATLFTYLFSLPIALIFTGIFSVVTKKDSRKMQLLILFLVFVLLQLFDFFIRRVL